MNKLLSDTRLVAAFAALVLVCVTVLVALGKVAWPDAVKVVGGFLSGLLAAWQRGTAPAVEVVKVEEKP
jgi:hypothetical protein